MNKINVRLAATLSLILMMVLTMTVFNPSDEIIKFEEAELKTPIKNEVNYKITLPEEKTIIVEGMNFDALNGVVLSDDSIELKVSEYSLNVGEHKIFYQAYKNDKKVATATRTLTILSANEDYDQDGYSNAEEFHAGSDFLNAASFPTYSKNPIVILNNFVEVLEVNTSIPEYGAYGNDTFEGYLNVQVSHNININKTGNYQVTYRTSDSLGNRASVIKNVRVVDTTAPVLVSQDININLKDAFTVACPTTVLAKDNYSNVTQTFNGTNFDSTTPGTYNCNYTLTDEVGNSNEISLKINVIEDRTVVIFKDVYGKTIKEERTYDVNNVTAPGYEQFIELNGETLEYSGLESHVAADGSITYTPIYNPISNPTLIPPIL